MNHALVLTTYPTTKPYHGGQKRVSELIRAYKRAGLNVISISIYDQDAYPKSEISSTDIAFPNDSHFRVLNGQINNYLSDYLSGIYIDNNVDAWRKINRIIKNKNIKLIHVEHPWLWMLAEKIKLIYPKSIIIYGSANIEHKLKQDILLQTSNLLPSKNKNIINKIKLLEIYAANNADVTLAVTKSDAHWIKKHCLNSNLLLIPNGTNEIKYNSEELNEYAKLIDAEEWFVFVGSAHPPNLEGFKECMGKSLACLPPTSKLLVVGTISYLLERYLFSDPLFTELNRSRVLFYPKIEDDRLGLFLKGAKGIILPITTGGGSNLKTAEALYSGNYIVGTNQSFRGFEQYKELNGVMIANDMYSFRASIRTASIMKRLVRTKKEEEFIKLLSWKNVTKPLTDLAKGII